jgi:Base plate wedge protein 53
MAIYNNNSPWYNTQTVQDYLDILTIRPVAADIDDFLYTIESQYAYRPDLLAYDLYGESSLWWVFIQRNLDVLQDPIYDFVPGTKIYIPKNSSLRTVLGI